MNSETRKRRGLDGNADTTAHDTDPPRPLRPAGGPTPPRPRPWILVLGAVCMIGGMLFLAYRLGASRATPTDAALIDSSPVAPASTRVLLVDPVCKRAVDPADAPAILEFDGKNIYFDSLDCANAFRADPIKYGAGRLRIRVVRQTEREGEGDVGATPVPEVPPLAEASPEVSPDLAPGGPPEPPGTDNSAAGEPSASETPPGDGPMMQPPEPPPDPGPQPSSRSVSDAPPVTESYPSQPPADLPKDEPAVSDPPKEKKAPAKTAKAKKAPSAPKTAPPAASPDENGFSLPPELKEGPPSRKAGQKTPQDDAPPSVNETAPQGP